jgi:hypothetical protein
MARTTTGTISSSLSWSATDTTQGQARVSDIGSIAVEYSFAAGTGTGQVNGEYNQVATLTSGGFVEYDLFVLTREILGAQLTTSFSGGYVQDLIVKNYNATGVIYIRTTGSNAFTNIFGGGSGNIPIYPESAFHLNNVLTGWAVNTGQRYIQIHDAGTGCLFGFAIIGRTGIV